jgi:hypothetical protein
MYETVAWATWFIIHSQIMKMHNFFPCIPNGKQLTKDWAPDNKGSWDGKSGRSKLFDNSELSLCDLILFCELIIPSHATLTAGAFT